MHPLRDSEYDFASPTTRERCQSHNFEPSALEAEQAETEGLAGQLDNLDPLTVAPETAERLARTVARRRHDTVKAAVALLQVRLPLLQALEQDRRQAEQEAATALEQRRAETAEALRLAGYGWLGPANQ